MSINLDRVREIADAYEMSVRTNAHFAGSAPIEEALAALIGASRCLPQPFDLAAMLQAVEEGAE